MILEPENNQPEETGGGNGSGGAYISLPAPDLALEQAATESLRIVAAPRQRRAYDGKKVGSYGLVLLMVLWASWGLATAKFLAWRVWLTQRMQSLPQPISLASPTISPSLYQVRWITINGIQFASWDHWGPYSQPPLWNYLAQGQFIAAEASYQKNIYTPLTASLRVADNILKYNGCAMRWLRMVQVWEQSHDEVCAKQLSEELNFMETQISWYVQTPETSAAFKNLIQKIREKIREKIARK